MAEQRFTHALRGLAVAIALALAACGRDNSTETTNAGTSAEPESIVGPAPRPPPPVTPVPVEPQRPDGANRAAPGPINRAGLAQQAQERAAARAELEKQAAQLAGELRDSFRPQHLLKGHTGGIGALAISPDGKMIASGGGDRMIRLWDAAKGALLRTLDGHEGVIHTLDFSADGRKLLAGDGIGGLIVWDADSGSIDRLLRQDHPAYHAHLFPDGKRFVSACGGSLRYWVESRDSSQHVVGKTGGITSLQVSPGGEVITGNHSGWVLLWDLPAEKIVKQHRRNLPAGAQANIQAMRFMKDNRVLIAELDGIWIWDLTKDTIEMGLEAPQTWRAAMTLDDTVIIRSAGDRFEYARWNTPAATVMSPRTQAPGEAAPENIYALAASQAGGILAIGRAGGWADDKWQLGGEHAVEVYDLRGVPDLFAKRDQEAALRLQMTGGRAGRAPRRQVAPWD